MLCSVFTECCKRHSQLRNKRSSTIAEKQMRRAKSHLAYRFLHKPNVDHPVQEGLAVASIAQDDPSTLAGDDLTEL